MKFKKLQHFNEPGHVHELTFSCYKNQDFFMSDQFAEWFIDVLQATRKKHNFKILAYVIMPNHVHIVIYPLNSIYDMGKILSAMKIPFSRRVIGQAKKSDKDLLQKMAWPENGNRIIYRFWQRRGGYDRNLISKEAVLNAIQYIHANPVRKSLVDVPEDWYWSSAGFYSGKE